MEEDRSQGMSAGWARCASLDTEFRAEAEDEGMVVDMEGDDDRRPPGKAPEGGRMT